MKKMMGLLAVACTVFLLFGCSAPYMDYSYAEAEAEEYKSLEEKLGELEPPEEREYLPGPEEEEDAYINYIIGLIDPYDAFNMQYSEEEVVSELGMFEDYMLENYTKYSDIDLDKEAMGEYSVPLFPGTEAVFTEAYFGIDTARFLYTYDPGTDDAYVLADIFNEMVLAANEKMGFDYSGSLIYDPQSGDVIGEFDRFAMEYMLEDSIYYEDGTAYACDWSMDDRMLYVMLQMPTDSYAASVYYDTPRILVQVDYYPGSPIEDLPVPGKGDAAAHEVIFGGLITNDELPEYEGILEVDDFKATPNLSGGYDCSVSIANVSYAMESSIYCLLFEVGTDYSYDIVLAEDDYFEKGELKTYDFEVPADMVSNADCEVVIEYTFW